MSIQIDINFDFRSDTPKGKDPDALSPTLRRYHKQLWSKPLPCGTLFDLDDTRPRAYLRHNSEVGKFFLASDTANTSWKNYRKLSSVRNQLPTDDLKRFGAKVYSMGNMVVFPGNQIERKWTINQARGCHRRIKDRFDLTLECIRLHYIGKPNPLAHVLNRYADFFDLFRDFQGYVDFFLLHDLVTDDCGAVTFFLPFDSFDRNSPHPKTVDEFSTYLQEATRFIDARNRRIREYARGATSSRKAAR